ncbi:sensor histidine kinase [Fodinicola feengrottensis]
MEAAGPPPRTSPVLVVVALFWLLPLAYPLIQLIRARPADVGWVPALAATAASAGAYVVAAIRTARAGQPRSAQLPLVLIAAVAILLPFAAGVRWLGGTLWLAAAAGFTLPASAALAGTCLATAIGAVTSILLRAPADTAASVAALTALAGVSVVVAIYQTQLARELATSTAEVDRLRVTSEVHETVKQQAFLAAAELRKAQTAAPSAVPAHLDRAAEAVANLQRQFGMLVAAQQPAAAPSTDFRAWVDGWAAQSGVEVELRIEDLDGKSMRTLFPIAVAALTNVAQHASAQMVAVMVRGGLATATLTVADDGAGFDPAVVPPGHGLRGMTERLLAAGGVLTIHSAPGQGTAITAEVPRG